MGVSDEFNLWKMATYEEETIWKYITAQGWGKEMFIVEIIQNFKAPCNCHLARRGSLCTVLVFCPNESAGRTEDKIASPPPVLFPRNTLLYLSDSERSFLCIFFSKESPFYCLQRFWTRCAKCSRCKLVAAMHRKCYWQECSKGRQCGNVAIGVGANWARQYIIRYITNTIQ